MLSKSQKRAILYTAGGLYVLASTAHAVMQRRYASNSSRSTSLGSKNDLPTIDVIITVFNESPERLEETLQSIEGQYQADKLNVYLVDDCSTKNREELEQIYNKYRNKPPWHIILREKNAGKRQAQDAAFQVSSGELILTGDSDSPFKPNAFMLMVARMQSDRSIGAVAGKVSVANADKNGLTKLLAERYRLMFELEREAQSRFGAVWTCTGPISMYRRSLLDAIWSDYLGQTYKGKPCLAGDDLQLTNLVIDAGYKAVYEGRAEAMTYVPETLEEYRNQQIRWNRSMFRDQLLSLRSAKIRSRKSGNGYPLADMVVRTYFPLLLVGPPALAALQALVRKSMRDEAVVMLAMLGTRGLITYLNAKPVFVSKGRFATAYGAVHVFMLVPGRIRAYLTRGNSSWVTRS
ncbi:glycosyltransferase [Shimazuella kribbensis]|uniref:glycosyltransferase n=1 Tax=Shimazuella kribbensis TaxID=139808 RepID=UPI00041F79B7|nr:glycosyltransferase [Shimazuella kribbensis]